MLLRTLGEVRLEGVPADLSGRRKDLTLLAYLARKAPHPVLRAELANLLWEDRDEARARQSLRQAVLELKRAAGDALAVDAEQVRLDARAVGFDVQEFETAIAEDRLKDAVDWWAGDFLAGHEDVGGETLRIWLEIERESLRRSLGFALDRLSADASGRGDWAGAVGWAERWTRFLPDDDRGQIRLIECLCLAGRTPEARVRYTAFGARLRTELQRDPSPELQALGERIERELSRDQARHRPGSAALFTPDMVGRSAALAELAAAWDAARAGRQTVVLVEGETGIGKSRLIDEFIRRVESSGPAVVVRLPPGEQGTGEPLTDALLARLASAPGLGAASPTSLAAIAARVPKIRERFSEVMPAAAAQELETAAAEAVSAVAEERPVLIFLDDAGLRGAADLAALGGIVHGAAGRVLTILAVGEGAEALPQGIVSSPHLRRLKLPQLTLAEVEALIASMVVLPPAERHAFAVRLHEEGGGNPLYTIELAASLVDEGILTVGSRGTWTLVHPERWSVPLSPSLRAVIERRTGRLSDDARAVAEAIARLDPMAEESAARHAADLPGSRFDAGLDELIARRLLRTGPSIGGGYQFHHQLVRRVILEGAARRRRDADDSSRGAGESRRRRGYVLAAVAAVAVLVVALPLIRHLTVRAPVTAADRRQVLIAPAELPQGATAADSVMARSLSSALERALGSRTPSPSAVQGTLVRMRRRDTLSLADMRTAREVATRLGVRLLAVPSVALADGQVTLAYRIESTATGETIRTRQRERTSGATAGAVVGSLANSAESDVASAVNQVPEMSPLPRVTTASLEALRAYAAGQRLSNTGVAGRVMLERAVTIDSGFASALSSLAYLSWFAYDQRSAERYAVAARDRLDGLPTPERLRASLDIANALEDWDTAIARTRDLIELNPAIPEPWQTLGQLLYFDRQFAAAIEAYDSSRARTSGPPPVTLLVNRATVVARVGRVAEAAKEYEQAFATDRSVLRHPFVNHEYGAVLVRLGRVADARAAYGARLAGTPDERAAAFRSMALLEAHLGHFARARELLDDAVSGSTATGDTLGAAVGLLLRAEVAMTQGDTTAAVTDLVAVERLAAVKPLPYEVVAHAVKLLARGHATARAASLLSRLEAQTTAVSDAARARLLMARGEVLLSRGRAAEGRIALEQALALDPTTDAKESAAFAAAASGAWRQAAQRYDSLAADRGIDWDGHAVIELGRYHAGRAWESAGLPERARERYEGFLTDWSAEPSDSTLPALLDARRRLGRL